MLVEFGQILSRFKGKFAIVGGAVPWLLLGNNDDMPLVGALAVDLMLDAEALGEGEYVMLAEALFGQGYTQRKAFRDIRHDYVHSFQGMATEPVPLEALRAACGRLLQEIQHGLDEGERGLLLSLVIRKPEWALFGSSHL